MRHTIQEIGYHFVTLILILTVLTSFIWISFLPYVSAYNKLKFIEATVIETQTLIKENLM